MELENNESADEVKITSDIDSLGAVEKEGAEKLKMLAVLRPTMESANAGVGMEAFSVLFSGTKFMKELAGMMSGFTDKMSNLVTGLTANLTPAVMKSTNTDEYAKLEQMAARMNYATMAKSIKLINPPKLSTNWLDYATHLNTIVDVTSNIDKDVLSPLAEYLAKAINKPDTLLSNSYTPKYVEKDIKKFQNTMKDFFKGVPKEHVYWGAAFRRNAEVPLFINTLIEAKRKTQILQPETVKKSVEVIAQRAKILAEKFENPTSGMKLNPKHSKVMSDIIFYAANMVELYTIVLQMIYELDQCVKYSMDEFNQAG